jgi:hypothetical protein
MFLTAVAAHEILFGRAPDSSSPGNPPDWNASVDGDRAFEPLHHWLANALEIAAIAHAPIESPRGFAVPLGFVSFDAEVLRRAEQYVLDNLGAYVADESLYREVAAALSGQKPS